VVDELSYAIDSQDRLVRLDLGFYEYAEENGWDGVGDCLGRSLWDYVAGEEVQKVQRLLVRRVREGEAKVTLPFRCETPEVIREMEIRIDATASRRWVVFTAELTYEEDRDEPQPLYDLTLPRSGEFLTMCAWCDRFLVRGEWLEVEEAARRLQLFRRAQMPPLDHGICPQCSRQMLAA